MMQPTFAENVTPNRPRPPRARRHPVYATLLLFLVAFLPAPQAVKAQDNGGGQQEQSEIQKRAADEKAEAEAKTAKANQKKAEAEAAKAEFDQRFPQSDIKTLEGKTALGENDKRVEEQLAGHISVAEAANRIAQVLYDHRSELIRDHDPKPHILVFNDGDIQLLLIYSAATKRVDAYKGRYDAVAAAEQAALAANMMWSVPTATCEDEAALSSLGAGVGGAGFFNPLGAATSFLGSFGEILSFFRTDVSIRSSVFDIGEPVVVTEVFRALRTKFGPDNVVLYYPKEIPPDFDPTRDSPVLLKLEALINSKANADTLAAQINSVVAAKTAQKTTLSLCKSAAVRAAAKLKAVIDAQQKVVDDIQDNILKQPGGKPTAALAAQLAEEQAKLQEYRSRLGPQITPHEANARLHDADIARLDREIAALQAAAAPLAALNAQADLLAKDIIKVDEKTGLNPLTAFIRAEMIQKFMDDNKAYWLKLRVVTAGGNTKVKTNLFADVFNGGNRVFYSGASIVEYNLYDRKGQSVLSDTTNDYQDYMKAKDVKKHTDDRMRVDQQ